MSQQDGILQLPLPPPGEYIPYGKDPLQFGELRLPDSSDPHGVVIVIHGGFWRAAYNLDHIRHLCVALNKAGMATWCLEYRRLGNEGGGWPGTFEDVDYGARQIEMIAGRYHLDRDRILALGHSAGGQLALWLAARQRLRAVVSLAGVADLRRAYELKLSNTVVADLLGGSPDSVPERYDLCSPIELTPLRIPQILIHGAKDTIVPFEISERYVNAARTKGDDATLIVVEDAGHFELIDPRTKQFDVVKTTVLRSIAG
jgi:dipeptidyl aminopeptidase/acylaminoacyl peptidase